MPDKYINTEDLLYHETKETIYISEEDYKFVGCSPQNEISQPPEYFKNIILSGLRNRFMNISYMLVSDKSEADLVVLLNHKICYYIGEKPTKKEQDAMNNAVIKSTVSWGFLGLIPVVGGGNDGYFQLQIQDIRKRKEYSFDLVYHHKLLVSIFTLPFVFFEFRESRIEQAFDPYLDLIVLYTVNRSIIDKNIKDKNRLQE
jgi:hypothetical protein